MSVDGVAIGEPMLEFNQLPVGADGARHYLEGYGGDTSNAAIAAARQGVRAAYLTAIGQDWPGDRFMALWQAEGVDVSAIRRDPARQTAVYFVTHDTNGHAFLPYRRDSAACFFGPDDVPEALIAGAKMLYASGISQGISPVADAAVRRAIAIARAAGVPVAYDTNYRAKLWAPGPAAAAMHAAIAECDIVLPSLDDAITLTGLTETDAIIDFYLRLGPKLVVLKRGAEGAVLATAERREVIPPFPCRPVDATGAGDAFCGSFLARLILGDTPAQAARYAGCAAALKCEGYGAVAPIPHAARVLEMLAG